MSARFCSSVPGIRKKRLRARPRSGAASSAFTRTRRRSTPVCFAASWLWATTTATSNNKREEHEFHSDWDCAETSKTADARRAQRSDPNGSRAVAKTIRARRGNQIVLVHAVAADADRAHQHTIFIERHAAGEDLNPVWQRRNRSARTAGPTTDARKFVLMRSSCKPDVERAPVRHRSAEWTSRSVVYPVRERTGDEENRSRDR